MLLSANRISYISGIGFVRIEGWPGDGCRSDNVPAGYRVIAPGGPACDAEACGKLGLTDEAIRLLVDRFYGRVRRDAVLGPVFARALGHRDEAWAAHLARLSDFWSSLTLKTGRYHGDPFSAHLRLPDLEPKMFERWLDLFASTCAELFEPEVADAFRLRAERVARSLRMGLFERLPARMPA